MIAQEKQQLKLLLIATSSYYGQKIPDDAMTLYVEDLEDLPFADVARALKDLRRDPKTIRCPMPAVIRDRIQPANTDENDAVEAASRIIAAVAKYGWNNSESAREYIGDLGWRVVMLDGGWRNVCETLTHDNIGMLRAQWRNTALAQSKRARAGVLELPPTLPTNMLGQTKTEAQFKLEVLRKQAKQIAEGSAKSTDSNTADTSGALNTNLVTNQGVNGPRTVAGILERVKSF